jgi:hypothetical protein
MIQEFISVYRLYAKHNTRRYALLSAWRIAVQRLPF